MYDAQKWYPMYSIFFLKFDKSIVRIVWLYDAQKEYRRDRNFWYFFFLRIDNVRMTQKFHCAILISNYFKRSTDVSTSVHRTTYFHHSISKITKVKLLKWKVLTTMKNHSNIDYEISIHISISVEKKLSWLFFL